MNPGPTGKQAAQQASKDAAKQAAKDAAKTGFDAKDAFNKGYDAVKGYNEETGNPIAGEGFQEGDKVAPGKVVNDQGEVVNDDHIITNTTFYSLYCMAYKSFDEVKNNKQVEVIDRAFVDRALSTYGLFNYFLNTCVGEYRIFDEIGTGNVTYEPYQPIADYFFSDPMKKEVLMSFLKNELKDVFGNEHVRVK